MGFVWYGGLGVGGVVCVCMCMGWRDVARGWDVRGSGKGKIGGRWRGIRMERGGRGGGEETEITVVNGGRHADRARTRGG